MLTAVNGTYGVLNITAVIVPALKVWRISLLATAKLSYKKIIGGYITSLIYRVLPSFRDLVKKLSLRKIRYRV